MQSFLQLSSLWGIIYNGLIGNFIYFVNMTIPQWILNMFGVTSTDDLIGLGKTLYDIIYDVLDAIPLVGTEETFATLSLMSIMLGVGIIFVVVYSIAKWIVGIVT